VTRLVRRDVLFYYVRREVPKIKQRQEEDGCDLRAEEGGDCSWNAAGLSCGFAF
jgi:hypothetical protein